MSPLFAVGGDIVKEIQYFTNKKILYECINLMDCLYNCLDTSGKKNTIIF